MARLSVRLDALRSNLEIAQAFCVERGLDFLFVTKLLQSRADVLAALGSPGLARVADVHGANFRGLDPSLYPHRAVLRPRFGDVAVVAGHADRVFLADPKLAKTLGEARTSLRPGRPLQVTLMVETGDLRDGVPWDDLPAVVRAVAAEPSLELVGLGTNFGCLAGAIPDEESLAVMSEGLRRLRKITGHPVPGFSLGGTVFWDLLRDKSLPPEFTELRLGEAVFFGWNTSLGNDIPVMNPDVFRLDLEVIEAWTKDVPSLPPGPAGFNAFGERPVQAFTGPRRRAVLDGGENLAPLRALTPLDPGCILVGETHEYTVIDAEAAEPSVETGGRVGFRPAYEAVARCFLSPFLELNLGEAP